jgi:hypothetical protein
MAMANSLQEKMELVVWGADQNVSSAARALVLEEMRYRIHAGVIWDLKTWAASKAAEHSSAMKRIDRIILAVVVNSGGSQEHTPSLKKLSTHHYRISTRYGHVADACNDHCN